LPIEKGLKVKMLKVLEADAIKSQRTQIFMETPYRNQSMIQEIVEVCGNDTLLCIAADITGSDELIQTKTIRDWRKSLPDIHKKPAIFLINK
ncbi:MAG TPA: SAM-dependent methyltransferase, partial [Cytophagaceae bacterium]|jgi:16S rRNA (cytidine1402-2'-O)-methyltransferase